jgi:hypothetical protein
MHDIINIPTDGQSWSNNTTEAPDCVYRISMHRGIKTLWQKHINDVYYHGYQIKRIAFSTRVAREWLQTAGYDVTGFTI